MTPRRQTCCSVDISSPSRGRC